MGSWRCPVPLRQEYCGGASCLLGAVALGRDDLNRHAVGVGECQARPVPLLGLENHLGLLAGPRFFRGGLCMADVAIVRCEDYTAVEGALRQAIELAGGLDWVRPGMKIALKVNLVAAGKPDSAVTTHPLFVAALARLLIARGAEVRVGDSPGGLYTAAFVGRIYAASGMEAVEETGAQLNHDFSQREAVFPEGKTLHTFQYTAWLDWADAVINVCKLKTHGMMGMSCAAKNLFGVVPGTLKPEYHFRHSRPEDFAGMILDLDDFVHPRLSVCDAIVGMEGNGPTAGTPRMVGAVLAARSPHALDLACAHIIGIRPDDVPTLAAAQRRGDIPATAAELDLAGALFSVPGYELVTRRSSLEFTQPFPGPLGTLAGKAMRRFMRARPAVEMDACVGCEQCARLCPAHAIRMRRGVPHINRHVCIGCFCCQEFCPKGAMKVKRTAIARFLGG